MAGRDFCFVHAADLHLDTPFEGVRAGAPEVADALADASLAAFDSIVALALARQAAFVVISGDVYDGPERGVRAQLRFHRGLEELSAAGIPSFVVHGNHDPVETGWSAIRRWPPGVTVFPSHTVVEETVERGGQVIARIQGISYPRRDVRENLALRFAVPGGPELSVGVLHCNVGSSSEHADYSPCTVDQLVATRIGYWALGHVHRHAVVAGSPGGPWVVYPGNSQGRSLHPGERGPKGAVVAAVQGGAVVAVEHVACDAVRFEELSVPVGDLADAAELCELLRAEGERRLAGADGRSVVLRAVLTGRGPVHADLVRRAGSAPAAILHELRNVAPAGSPFIWWDSVVDRTRPSLDRDALRGRGDFAADVVALADRLAGDEAALAVLAGRAGDEPMPAALRSLVLELSMDLDQLRELLDGAADRALDLLDRTAS
jgi:exonuclease SbcD